MKNHELVLTHLDKVFWPEEGYTKGDLIEYYKQVAPLILPYLKNRPESLLRFPGGIDQVHFFQKEALTLSKSFKTFTIQHSDKEVHYLIINDLESLLHAINLGCIDLNPFNARIQNLTHPDFIIIDLDPEKAEFEQVIEVAHVVHHLLDSWNLTHLCKTSGATGLHIYLPLKAKYTFEEALLFAKFIAYKVHDLISDITSVERSPSKRQGKVYLDYLQNGFGQTVAAPYCVRPRPGAPVSTPLMWEEVKKGLNPLQFTIKTAPTRFEKVGDLFKPILERGIDIKKILKNSA